jgi:cell envelope-related function transcriptional attenuator common domain
LELHAVAAALELVDPPGCRNSIDPQARTASLLSIPRDLWFWTGIAEEPLRQVNRFYALAELDERGAGGRAVKEMLQANLGVPVSAYAVIDFQVFVRLINAIGGVEIELSQPIDDPRYPDMNLGYEPFYLPAGRVHLDGETALKFARTRNIDSDYGRIGRQQRLLMAIRDKLMQPDVWPQFVARVPSLWTEVRARVDTDLTIEQVTQLALFVRAVEPDDIALDTLAATDEGYVQRHTLDDGRRVWAVMPELASDYVRALFRME